MEEKNQVQAIHDEPINTEKKSGKISSVLNLYKELTLSNIGLTGKRISNVFSKNKQVSDTKSNIAQQVDVCLSRSNTSFGIAIVNQIAEISDLVTYNYTGGNLFSAGTTGINYIGKKRLFNELEKLQRLLEEEKQQRLSIYKNHPTEEILELVETSLEFFKFAGLVGSTTGAVLNIGETVLTYKYLQNLKIIQKELIILKHQLN